MLQQTLTYYVLSKTVTLSNDNSVQKIYSNSTYEISGSEYETGPGGFKSTVAAIRINVVSGSTLLASFPYDETNLIINSSSTLYTTSSNNVILGYKITYPNEYNPSFYFNIKESSSLNLPAQAALTDGTNLYAVGINSSSKYIVEAYSGNNKYNELSLYNSTGSLISTSSWITGSGSVVLELTGSSLYSINFVTSGSTCCSPTLTAVEGLGYERLSFTYTTGSCGTFDSMSVFRSTDQINWTILASGSSPTNITSNSGSYPVLTSYYRLIQNCDDGMDVYNSDPSNILYFVPSPPPVIPNYYYVSIVGRVNSGTGNLGFDYSPNSGSTAINLGYFYYTTTYQPITSFYILSGSILIINPGPCYGYGVGYNGGFSGYGSSNVSASGNYGKIISSSTTIYVNIDLGSAVC